MNRFRLAVSFRGGEIEGDEDQTYGALTKLFLIWSTFEMYCYLCDKPYHKMFFNYPKKYTYELADAYWEYDNEEILIHFLIEHTYAHDQDYYLRELRDGHKLRALSALTFSDAWRKCGCMSDEGSCYLTAKGC